MSFSLVFDLINLYTEYLINNKREIMVGRKVCVLISVIVQILYLLKYLDNSSFSIKN